MVSSAQFPAETSSAGEFVRQKYSIRDRFSADGSTGFPAVAGFATTQRVYERAVVLLFARLDWLEARLSTRTFLVGERLTEADIRLFTTLVRFDAVYHGHFKCNIRRLVDYPNLWNDARMLFQRPAFGETVNFDHIKRHYYTTHDQINPNRIVPKGPAMDWTLPVIAR